MATRGRPRKSAYPPSTPEKKEPPEAKGWLEAIDRAKRVKEEWRKQFRVDLQYEYFEGRHRPSHIPAAEWITINLIYSTLRAELPSLYSTDPYYYVKLKRSFSPNPMDVVLYETRAKIRQAHLNYLKGELDLKPKSRMSIFDAMFQFGVTKTFLKGDRIENPEKGKAQLGEDGRPVLDEEGNPLLQPDFLVENKEYCVERLHPDDFLVDENAGPLGSDVSWMAHRIKRTLAEVKADKSREPGYRSSVRATEIHDEAEKAKEQRKKGSVYASGAKKPDADIVVEWEIYDLKKGQWLVVAEGCDYFGVKPEKVTAGIEKHPFSFLRFTLRDSSWYPIPPVSQLIDPQREYSERRSKILVHAKRFNRKYQAYSQGMLDPQKGMAALENGEDGTIIEVSTPLAAPAVAPILDAPLDQQVHVELAYLRKDFDELAIGANQRGGTQGVDSATEAGILEKRTLIREGDSIGLVTDFLVSIGRKMDQLVQAHIDRDTAVRVAGPEGEAWHLVKQSDYREINGEYEYSIAVGSTTPQLPEIERAQMIGFLQIIAGPGIVLALEPTLFKRLAETFGLDDSAVEAAGRLAQKMVQGQIPWPGQQGSAPNTGGTPAASMGGMAMGSGNVMSM